MFCCLCASQLLRKIQFYGKSLREQNWSDFWEEDVKARVGENLLFTALPSKIGYFGTIVFIMGLTLRAAVKTRAHVSTRAAGLTKLLSDKYSVRLGISIPYEYQTSNQSILTNCVQIIQHAYSDTHLDSSVHFHGSFVQATKDLGFGAPANVMRLANKFSCTFYQTMCAFFGGSLNAEVMAAIPDVISLAETIDNAVTIWGKNMILSAVVIKERRTDQADNLFNTAIISILKRDYDEFTKDYTKSQWPLSQYQATIRALNQYLVEESGLEVNKFMKSSSTHQEDSSQFKFTSNDQQDDTKGRKF